MNEPRANSFPAMDKPANSPGFSTSPTVVRLPWLRTLLRIVALSLGAAHTVVAIMQQSMNEDGIDYLDMGDAWLRGDWDMAVNGIWSPLYSWILGAMVHLFQPSIAWEFPAVQITNFFVYAIALFCFEYFWRELTIIRGIGVPNVQDRVDFHPAAWMALGYSLFIWCSLNLVEIWAVNPDMCVAAIVYVAAGCFIRIGRDPGSLRSALGLGLILGLGYLAKAAMMPLALVLVLLCAGLPNERIGRLKTAFVALVGFLLIAGPFMAALSMKYGSLTFSEVSRFAYLKHVNEMPYPNFHPVLDCLDGVPEHPPRKIFDDPPVYEFAEPVGGTYAMSYDPGYWTEGLNPRVELPRQARAVATQGMVYFDLFFRLQGGFLATVLLLLLMSQWGGAPPARRGLGLLLTVWATAALGLYSLVYVTARYIAPFVLLLWAGLLTMVRFGEGPHHRRLANASGLALILFVWINIAALNLEGLAAIGGFSPLSESGAVPGQFSDGHRADHPAIAEAILEDGLETGDHVGFIGYSFSAYWARLARLRIVAEIHPEDMAGFWEAGPEKQQEILQAFASAGLAAVVSEPAPPGWSSPGWEEVGRTGYLIYRFP